MGTMTIDGRKVEFTDEKNVLTVIRKAGINIPTLCYHSEVSTFGACRLCTVEDDRGRTFASCSEEPRDGMVIYTNSGKIKKYRKLVVELLLAAHCRDCTTCVKSGECVLQELAHRLGVENVRFQNTREQRELDLSSPSLVRDPNKCILCGNCVRACEELQSIGALGFAFRGTEAMVMPAFDRKISTTDCVNCGQCRVFCPTGAISIRTNMDEVWEALADPNVRVVAQVAPAVRVAVGDHYGLTKGRSVMGKIVNALHLMGFDEVYDTSFSADLTIMEESAEFLDRIKKGEKLPLLTSCCPAWVKFVTDQYKDYIPNLSTCRSPQAMFGALLKEEARMKAAEAEKEGRSLRKTVVISIMPCTAKKAEIKRPEHFTEGQQDVDYVLTTTEVTRMIKEAGIDLSQIEPEALDMPFGLSSGAAAIFGVTGGVTEAVLRRLVHSSRMEDLQDISFTGIRGIEGIKEASIQLEDRTVKIAVVNGLRCAETLLERIKAGEVQYDFVEVMACKRGCIAGGGQPVPIGPRTKQARLDGMYKIDSMAQIKRSDENPIIAEVYEGILKGKEHKLLHNR